MIYLTGDEHFDHGNILNHCNRPWKDIKEHNQAIIDSINKVVRPNDELWHLGDFAWWGLSENEIESLRRRIKCRKQYLIVGNHDEKSFRKGILNNVFQRVVHIAQIKHRGYKIILCHYPFLTWPGMHRGSLHFHGHTHGNLPIRKNVLDVGVDNCDYKPLSIDEAIQRCTALQIK